jgi:hypothetical protein
MSNCPHCHRPGHSSDTCPWWERAEEEIRVDGLSVYLVDTKARLAREYCEGTFEANLYEYLLSERCLRLVEADEHKKYTGDSLQDLLHSPLYRNGQYLKDAGITRPEYLKEFVELVGTVLPEIDNYPNEKFLQLEHCLARLTAKEEKKL